MFRIDAHTTATLVPRGEGTWFFTITHDGTAYEAGSTEYRTGFGGSGLWVWGRTGNQWYGDGSPVEGWRQIEGYCDFALSADRRRARRELAQRFGMPE